MQGVVGVGISMVDSDYELKDDHQGCHLSFYCGINQPTNLSLISFI